MTYREYLAKGGFKLAWVDTWKAVGVLTPDDTKRLGEQRMQSVVAYQPGDRVGDVVTVGLAVLSPLGGFQFIRVPFQADDLHDLEADDRIHDVYGEHVVVRCRCVQDECSGVSTGKASSVVMKGDSDSALAVVHTPIGPRNFPLADVYPAHLLVPAEAVPAGG